VTRCVVEKGCASFPNKGGERKKLLASRLEWDEQFTTSWTLLDLEQEKSLPVIENFRTNGIVSISSAPTERTAEDE
jgi:hypothetical protein